MSMYVPRGGQFYVNTSRAAAGVNHRPGTIVGPQARGPRGAVVGLSSGSGMPDGRSLGTVNGMDFVLPPLIADFPITIISSDYPTIGTWQQMINAMNVIKTMSVGDATVYPLTGTSPTTVTYPTTATRVLGIAIMGGKVPLSTNAYAPIQLRTSDFLNGSTSINRDVTFLCSATGIGTVVQPIVPIGSLGGMIFMPFAYRGGYPNAWTIMSDARGAAPTLNCYGGALDLSSQLLVGDSPIMARLSVLIEHAINA